MDAEWPVRFLVLEGIATITETEHMTIDEVFGWLDARTLRGWLTADYEKWRERKDKADRRDR